MRRRWLDVKGESRAGAARRGFSYRPEPAGARYESFGAGRQLLRAAALRGRPGEVDPPGHFVPIRGHVAHVEAHELTDAKSGTQGESQ